MSRSERRALVALFVIAAARALAACSDSTTNPPCAYCGASQVCLGEVCLTRCNSNAECAAGHRCVSSGAGPLVCGEECDPVLCATRGDRYDCRGSACVQVACSARVTCVDPTAVCDIDGRCISRDGTCVRGVVDCPRLSGAVAGVAIAVCSAEGACRVVRTPRFVVPTMSEVTVTRPDDAHRLYASAADVRFAWSPQPHAQIVLVLGRVPTGPADLSRAALWGSVVPAGGGEIAWSAGHDIANGAWLSTLADPPTGRTLYLLVQSVDAGSLRGESALAPFAVGARAPWSLPGASCDQTHPCDASAYALVCLRGQCRVACGSDEDCRAAGRSTCADPLDGARVCE